jgi:alpha,alpha-trehalose phosphorylase
VLQDCRLRVEIKHKSARYLLVDGDRKQIRHHGTAITLTAGKPSVLAIPPLTLRPRARQPAGREPVRRRAAAGTVPG